MRVTLSLLLALLIPVAAVGAAPAPARHHVMADVVVSPEGRIAEFAVDARFKGLEGVLRGVAMQWRFKPATFDGQLVAVHTTLALVLHTEGGSADGDEMQVRLEYVGNGSGIDRMVHPRYPSVAARDGAAAVVLLAVTHDATGRVTDVAVSQSKSSRKQHRKAFDVAALDAARRWVFKPERVNGVALPGQALVPVVFRFSRGDAVPALPPSAESAALASQPDVLLHSDLPLALLADSD